VQGFQLQRTKVCKKRVQRKGLRVQAFGGVGVEVEGAEIR